MKIGLDFDGVIFDFENNLRIEAEMYDHELKEKGLKNGIIDARKVKFEDRYNWDENSKKHFFNTYFDKVNRYADFIPGAKLVLDKLKEDGHELIIISARGAFEESEIDIAEKKINEKGVQFSEINWKVTEKLEMCKSKNIDIMIDDRYGICKTISENKIKTIYFRDKTHEEIEENEYLKEGFNWGQIYRTIKNFENIN